MPKFCCYTDFLSPLQLDDLPIMDHQLDRTESDAAQSPAKLEKHFGGEGEPVAWVDHDPIYPI